MADCQQTKPQYSRIKLFNYSSSPKEDDQKIAINAYDNSTGQYLSLDRKN